MINEDKIFGLKAYGLEAVYSKAKAMGFDRKELGQVAHAYWFGLDYYKKHHPVPTDWCARLGYAEDRYRDAYRLAEYTMIRIIDEHHTNRRRGS